MEPLKISVHDMVAAAKARITEITAKDALNLIADKNVVIVGKRYQGSILASFARFIMSTTLVRVPMAPKVS